MEIVIDVDELSANEAPAVRGPPADDSVDMDMLLDTDTEMVVTASLALMAESAAVLSEDCEASTNGETEESVDNPPQRFPYQSMIVPARLLRPLPSRRRRKASEKSVETQLGTLPEPGEKTEEAKKKPKKKKPKGKRNMYKGPLPHPYTRGQTVRYSFWNNFEVMDEVIGYCNNRTKAILMRVNKPISLYVGDILYRELHIHRKLKIERFMWGLTEDTILHDMKRNFERYTKIYRLCKVLEVLRVDDHSRKLCQLFRNLHKIRLRTLRPMQLRQLRALRVLDINGACGGHQSKDSSTKQPRVTGSCHFWHAVHRQVEFVRWHTTKDLPHVTMGAHKQTFQLLTNKYFFQPPRCFDIIMTRRAINIPSYPIDPKDGQRLLVRLHITGRDRFKWSVSKPYELLYNTVHSDEAMISPFLDTLAQVISEYHGRNARIQVIGLGRLEGRERPMLEADEAQQQAALLTNLRDRNPDVETQVKFMTRDEARREKKKNRERDDWWWCLDREPQEEDAPWRA